VPTDQHTPQGNAKPDVFVIGDAADVPASKAGSVEHFEGEIVARDICRYLAGEPLDAGLDGHAKCFIESGFGKALLRQSRLNHLGKLAFGWLYWHMLLPGRDIPAVPGTMPMAGKHTADTAHTGPAPN
jgi:sulfide:quinone oxidoreductase